MSTTRGRLLDLLAARIIGLGHDGPVRVAVDGADGAGKTVFADALGDVLVALGRPVIRAGVDSFHAPRAIRYARGRGSAEGFFRDSYDYEVLRATLLDPLSPGGDRRYRTAAFDHVEDRPVVSPENVAPRRAVLVFDGIFPHRPELRSYWDFSVFLRVRPAIATRRVGERDGAPTDVDAPSNQRYVRGQRLYLAECEPDRHADVVIDNEDFAAPRLLDT